VINPDPGGFKTYVDPVPDTLKQFPAECGAAAEKQAKKDTPESDGGCFRRAGELLGELATGQIDPVDEHNLRAMLIPHRELQKSRRFSSLRREMSRKPRRKSAESIGG
jgi:hypothetical protein